MSLLGCGTLREREITPQLFFLLRESLGLRMQLLLLLLTLLSKKYYLVSVFASPHLSLEPIGFWPVAAAAAAAAAVVVVAALVVDFLLDTPEDRTQEKDMYGFAQRQIYVLNRNSKTKVLQRFWVSPPPIHYGAKLST